MGRVFSDSDTRESRQKGFKTLQARVKTIWDEKDHDILGVSPKASRKEVIKAWRMLSLEHHPDKVIDEDKKEEAEEMMKRLNLAKQNMLRAATDDPSGDHSPGEPDGPPVPQP